MKFKKGDIVTLVKGGSIRTFYKIVSIDDESCTLKYAYGYRLTIGSLANEKTWSYSFAIKSIERDFISLHEYNFRNDFDAIIKEIA